MNSQQTPERIADKASLRWIGRILLFNVRYQLISDESAETVILDLQDDLSGLGLAINDETLEFAKRLPAITASSIPLVHNSLLTPIARILPSLMSSAKVSS